MNELENEICRVVVKIARRRSPTLASVTHDQALVADLGLESLDIAELVATLEVQIGRDPFAKDVAISTVKTVADLCRAYG